MFTSAQGLFRQVHAPQIKHTSHCGQGIQSALHLSKGLNKIFDKHHNVKIVLTTLVCAKLSVASCLP